MNWTIPGTTLTGQRENAHRVDRLFQSRFLAGGLTLSQVASITGLEPYTIQNWVKRKFLAPPQGKRYDMEQVCRIININLLKGALPLEKICTLMSFLNGDLAWEQALEEATAQYREPYPGARDRVIQVLRIMLTAWVAGRLRQEAEAMLSQI